MVDSIRITVDNVRVPMQWDSKSWILTGHLVGG